MLKIEIDMFSGRPNPAWILTDLNEVKRLLDAVADAPKIVAKQGAGFAGLGLREVIVTVIRDDIMAGRKVPARFALASSACRDLQTSGALAARLIETMPLRSAVRLGAHAVTPLDAKLRGEIQKRLAGHLDRSPRPRGPVAKSPSPSNPLRTTIQDDHCTECHYEVSKYNPGFWNNDPVALSRNNCYNYSRNWRTDNFAQPGYAHNAMTSNMACSAVTKAAMADGLVKRCACLPDSEEPRRLMALVIDPGYDYHWYRHQRGGFWGHKPGQTPARNFDNSNMVVINPETADRGGYVDFCGYFYAGLSVVISGPF